MKSLLRLSLLAAPLCAFAANPIVTDVHTADPAALVHGDTVYVYTGHDEAPPNENRYVMKDWLCFSSKDMVSWKAEGSPLSLKEFTWAKRDAWAGHTIERNGKFYWYVPVHVEQPGGFAIGVAVSDSPTGPFKDALGKPLLTSDMTPDPINPEGRRVTWDDIDPAIFIDDDGQAYMFWGNTNCYMVKLKANMTELDGPISKVDVPAFTEAPWVHKHGGTYYLSYASRFPELTVYATASKITGPWTYRNVILGIAGNCNTNHQAIIEFKGKSYIVYHNGGTLTGGSFRRSVCVDELHYNADGTIRRVTPSEEGITVPAK